MKDPETKNNLFIKLAGKAEVPKELEIGKNYEIKIQGTVTSMTESDNENGSHSIYYRVEPVLVELVTDKGESIKARDTRSSSQLFRARLWKQWQNASSDLSFDDWYSRLMVQLIQRTEEIVEMYG